MVSLGYNKLTHCGRVTPYGDKELGQHCLMAPSYYLKDRVPTASRESKLRTFQGLFQDQTRCFKDFYGKFHNADILKTYYLNEQTCLSH